MARKEVWALDIGEAALKAVKARRLAGRVEALAFDVIPYKQVLSAPGVDADAQVRQALTTFMERNEAKRERVVAAISARSALIRFIKLPPVEPKKIPNVVQYEASQHIPFPLDEVVWDHQPMRGGQVVNFEVEVGMFALRKEIVRNFLTNLLAIGLRVDKLQLTPIALYNFVYYDRRPKEALVVLDVGAVNSTFLVVEGETVWTRSLGIGGNDFTRALASKFNLPFPKAEVLKRRAATNEKYAKQVFNALRTPARNLVDEVQRSIGYYKSVHKEARIERILLLGSSFALTELARFIGVTLSLEMEVFREPKNISIGAAVGLDKYREYATSFGVALGLAVEGLGLGAIDTNMLPKEVVRSKELGRKRPFIAAAAALILLSVLTAFGFAKTRLPAISRSGDAGKKLAEELVKLEQDVNVAKNTTQKTRDDIEALYKAGGTRRDIWLDILDAITASVPTKDPKSAILLTKLTSEVTEEEVSTAEEKAASAEAKEAEALSEWEADADLDLGDPLERLEDYGEISPDEWDEGLSRAQQNQYKALLRQCEHLGLVRVLDWNVSPPRWEEVGAGAPGVSVIPGTRALPSGVSALAFVGIKKIFHLKLTAERRALTKNLSAAVDEIEADFVEPLRKYPFFVEVKMGNANWETYMEDEEGFRLGKLATYTAEPGVETRNVDWITFDVLITVDPTKGSSEAAASTAATVPIGRQAS